MKKILFVMCVSIMGWSVVLGQDTTKHVVLISIDGLRPEFYLDSLYPAPLIQKMARQGAYANGVLGVFPSVTYPSHTTIITGKVPAEHGIYYNSPFEPLGQTGRWYWEEELIKTETLWDVARKAGLTTASVSWPVSVGAPIDYNIPEVFPADRKSDRIEPMRRHTTPKGLFEEVEREATGTITQHNFNGDYLTRDTKLGLMAAHLLEKYKPNLMTVHLIAADHFQHEAGRTGGKVKQAVQTVDHAVGLIYEAAHRAGILSETTFIITGDHGFVDIHTAVSPNVWLAAEGLVSKDSPESWKAKFHTSGASAFLHLKDKGDQKTAEKVMRILRTKVPAEQQKLFKILDRQALREIGADPDAVLALAPVKGVTMNSNLDGEAVNAAKGGTHGFTSDIPEIKTGFIAWGPQEVQKGKVELMKLQDIFRIVCELLKLPQEDGKLPLVQGILKP